MENKEIILNDIIKHLDLLINNEPIGMELSKYIERLKNEILFLFKSLKEEKPKLTEDEKVILRNLPKDYKWIARNLSGMVHIFIKRPKKGQAIWCGGGQPMIPFYHIFQFIKWEDDEPYLIEDLLKGE